MQMVGRSYNAGSYAYGFNGKRLDNEVSGNGNQYDFGSRIYDPRLGRFLSIDPFATQIPFSTPYSFAGNKPIWAIDADGEVEVIINYIHKDANGKVSRKSYNMGDIKTAEDIRGISRTPIQINVYSESVLVQQGNMQYFTHKQTKVEIVKESGETKGEEMKRTDPLQYYLAKLVIDNPLGTGKLNMAAQKRDPFTGERISNGQKASYLAEGLINMATLGRASNTGNLTKVLKSWTQDFFAEQGSEIFFKKMEGVFGIDASEHAVIIYHVANLAMDGKKGELNDLRDFLLRSADVGLKGDKFLNKLREERGINAEIPKDAKEAAKKVIKDFNISGQH
jgi:RHS repeat-associated protein